MLGDPVRAGGSHQRGDCGDLGAIILPGLQILQSKSDELCRQSGSGWIESLSSLEGVVLQLQHEPARLLPLRLPLLRRLPPAPGRERDSTVRRPAPRRPPAGP